MASRKDQKEQARAARVAQEQQALASKQRTRRLQIIGGVVAIAVAVVVVAIVVSSSGGGSGGKNTSTGLAGGAQRQQIVNAVNAELDGIPQKGNRLGSPNAPTTMTYFGDLQCPVCAAFTTGSEYSGQPPAGGLPEFIQKQVRTGKVKVIYKSYCTASCNNTSFSNPQDVFDTQQVAAYAAGMQNKAWYYIELFYHQQKQEGTPYVTEGFLHGIANEVKGLNIGTWKTDRGNPALLSQVKAEDALAVKQQLPGTPSLIMTGPTGKQTLVNNGDFASYSDLAAAVKAVQ